MLTWKMKNTNVKIYAEVIYPSVPRRYVLTMTIYSQMKIYSVFLNFI